MSDENEMEEIFTDSDYLNFRSDVNSIKAKEGAPLSDYMTKSDVILAISKDETNTKALRLMKEAGTNNILVASDVK